jgi:hypothetical protein
MPSEIPSIRVPHALRSHRGRSAKPDPLDAEAPSATGARSSPPALTPRACGRLRMSVHPRCGPVPFGLPKG